MNEAEIFFRNGLKSHQSGDIDIAIKNYTASLEEDDNHYNSLHFLGLALVQTGKIKEGIVFIKKSIEINSNQVLAYNHLGGALISLGEIDEAIIILKNGLLLEQNQAQLKVNLGIAYEKKCDRINALNYYNEAISIDENSSIAYYNRGNCLMGLKRFYDAAEDFKKSIALGGENFKSLNQLGLCSMHLNKHDNAIDYFTRSIESNNKYSDPYYNLGNLYSSRNQFEKAAKIFSNAIESGTNINKIMSLYVLSKLKNCDWENFELIKSQFETALLKGESIAEPFIVLGTFDNPKVHKIAADAWAHANNFTRIEKLAPYKTKSQKIILGYFSPDFRNHAVGYLIEKVIQLHNRDKFEVHGISFGPKNEDAAKNRIKSHFDKFYEVSDWADNDIVSLCRKNGIDIAIDLAGYTAFCRTKIFADNCAPIQVNYLGYPGTMGGNCYDYIILDRIIASEDTSDLYSESIKFLPNCYQPNESLLDTNSNTSKTTRQMCGLPENAFIYCCFNNCYKIQPNIFKLWIEILKQVPNSVLWLLHDSDTAANNLLAEMEKCGLEKSRLIFAFPMSHADHIERHKLADLFLDTYPYNAHTTASDSLKSGVPILTLIGKSFPSRVASSLLNVLELKDMISYSENDYKLKAISLGSNPNEIVKLKSRLKKALSESPFLDTQLFTKNLEDIYIEMYNENCDINWRYT